MAMARDARVLTALALLAVLTVGIVNPTAGMTSGEPTLESQSDDSQTETTWTPTSEPTWTTVSTATATTATPTSATTETSAAGTTAGGSGDAGGGQGQAGQTDDAERATRTATTSLNVTVSPGTDGDPNSDESKTTGGDGPTGSTTASDGGDDQPDGGVNESTPSTGSPDDGSGERNDASQPGFTGVGAVVAVVLAVALASRRGRSNQ